MSDGQIVVSALIRRVRWAGVEVVGAQRAQFHRTALTSAVSTAGRVTVPSGWFDNDPAHPAWCWATASTTTEITEGIAAIADALR